VEPAVNRRNRIYFLLMGTSVTLVVLAWWLVRLYSVTAAIIMSVVAMAIRPIAVIVANAGDEASRHQ
jgi:NhaP-type Na+/H+ or K+/H+ antiporter